MASVDAAKLLRTAQSYFPTLKPAKDAFYRHVRRLAGVPHEHDFRVLPGLDVRPGEVLIDVGANHGQSIESIRLYQPSAQIVAFEASPALAGALQHRYADEPLVRVELRGLGATAGAFMLHTPSYGGFVYDGLASLDRREAETWLGPRTLYGFDPAKLTVAQDICRIETLDSFGLAAAFLKIDVQGCEYDVLVGAAHTIEASHPALLIEDFETDPRIGAFTARLGYDIFHVTEGRVVPGAGPGPNTLLLHRQTKRFSPAAFAS